jgi:ferredoxin
MEYCVGCSKCAAKCPAGISAPSVASAVAHYLRKQKREEAAFFEERV